MKNILFLLVALTTLSCAVAQAAPSVTVGDPKDPGSLAQAIQGAYKNGARQIVIHPGTYLLPNVGHTAITLDGWKDATLSADHVTLIITDLAWEHNVFDIVNCTNVTLEGALLSQTGLISYQGRVVAVGKDAAGKAYCDWRPDVGYPVPPADQKNFLSDAVNVVDAHTRLLKVGTGDFYSVKAAPQADGTFRALLGGNIAVGDWLVGRYGNAPFKVDIRNSRDCTLKNVTMMRNGFAPLREEGGGGNHYLHCVWALGPRPQGATEDPLVTNAADGMHMTSSDPGPDIENCDFQGVFLDDCIAIHGYFKTIKSASGNAVIIDGGAGDLRVGQPARISDQKGFFAEGTVTAIKDNGDNTTTVMLDKDYAIPASAKMSNPRADGAGYKIIGCHLGSTRSRGILAKADGGLIKGNVLEHCGMSAVSLGPEYYWGEADYVQNVTVEDNVIRGVGGAAYGGAAILVHGDGAIGNQNIVIRNNRMTSNYQGDMDLQWVNGLTVAGNVITGAAQWPPSISTQSLISLANCRAVTLSGNAVHHASVYKPALVAVGNNVTGLMNDAGVVASAH